ncbi:MAG: deoxyribose-phosphate aldolase [Planctomycetota bacterium]
MNADDIAGTIDHTLLKAEALPGDVDRLVDEAVAHGFASVCVNGVYLGRVVERLRAADAGASGVKACAVAGFPLGAMKEAVKSIEATALAKDDAAEIDFVAHLPHLLAKDRHAARTDFLSVTTNVRSVRSSVVVKVIIESAALLAGVDEAEGEARIAVACEAAAEAGCDFVKTSTGFHPAGGASVAAVQLMRKHAPNLKVKASGGIRNREDALRMLDAGADRLGCSAGVAIVRGESAGGGY